jgi:hypothetical protein
MSGEQLEETSGAAGAGLVESAVLASGWWSSYGQNVHRRLARGRGTPRGSRRGSPRTQPPIDDVPGKPARSSVVRDHDLSLAVPWPDSPGSSMDLLVTITVLGTPSGQREPLHILL